MLHMVHLSSCLLSFCCFCSSEYELDAAEDSDDSNSSSQRASSSRAAVAASLDAAGFSEDFLNWAAAGEGLEGRLLADLGQKGADASCKTVFVLALLQQLVAAGSCWTSYR